MTQRPSAAKSMRRNKARYILNKSAKNRLRTEIKKFEKYLERNDADAARDQFMLVTKLLHQAVKKGFMHQNTAARKQGRLQLKLNELAGAE